MAKCEIKWIDKAGNPTPDDCEAIGRVKTIERVEQVGGRGVKFDASPWFNICACHAQRLGDRGMHIWLFEPFQD
jgi:hypothetical protein